MVWVMMAALGVVVAWMWRTKARLDAMEARLGAGERAASSGPPSGTRTAAPDEEPGEEGLVLPFARPRLLREPRRVGEEGAVLGALLVLEQRVGVAGLATFAQAAQVLALGRHLRLTKSELCLRIVRVAEIPEAHGAEIYVLADLVNASVGSDGSEPGEVRATMLPGGAA